MSWQELESEPTEDLIEMMCWKENPDDYRIAENAFTAFFFRFREDVVRKTRTVARNWGYDTDVGDAIAENAFTRFWKNPSTFNSSKCKSLDINRCVRVYLYRIAQNLLADHRKLEDNPPAYTGEEEIMVEFPDLEKMNVPVERLRDMKKMYELINGALERLTPKHKIIYLTYRAFEKDGMKLPRKLLQNLRDELDLTQSTIRVYKKEANEVVETFLKVYGSK